MLVSVQAVLDSSSAISLARAGLLGLIDRLQLELVILDVVVGETVGEGLVAGHADAAAIEAAFENRPVLATSGESSSADSVILAEAVTAGMLVSNDLALGRRARNLGASWLRTADLVIVAHELGSIGPSEARAAIVALRDAGRITPSLADSYLEELRP